MSIAPWSFSKIKSFEQCPKKFYHLKVAKSYKEPETEAMLYGTAVHLAAEEYIRDGTPLPEKYAYCKDVLDALNNIEGEKLCELEMGLTENLEPCGFRDDNVWWRGIADLVILNKRTKTAYVVDYKTSKNTRYADKGQLELMALSMFKLYPDLESVKGGLLFVVCNGLSGCQTIAVWSKRLRTTCGMHTRADYVNVTVS
jgi:CRISPR/Cas system-associated exonuclease Cas4 (RecB family)